MRAISFFSFALVCLLKWSGTSDESTLSGRDPLGEVGIDLVRWHPHPQWLPGTYAAL